MPQSSENPYQAPSVLESPEPLEPLPWKQPALMDFLRRGVLVALVTAPFWFVYIHFLIEQDLFRPGTIGTLACEIGILSQFCLQCCSKAWLMGLCSSLVPHRKAALHFVAVGVGVCIAENFLFYVGLPLIPSHLFPIYFFLINGLFPAMLLSVCFVWLTSRRFSKRAAGIIAVTSIVLPLTAKAIISALVETPASSSAIWVTVRGSLGVVSLAFMLWIASHESQPREATAGADRLQGN